MFRTPSLRDSISVTLRKLLEGGSSGEVRLYTSLQQREQAVWTLKVRYQVREFISLCMGRCKPLGSLNSFLSYASQLSGANPVFLLTLLLAFPQLFSSHHGGWQCPLDSSCGSPHSHLEPRNRWWLWHFLFIDMQEIFSFHTNNAQCIKYLIDLVNFKYLLLICILSVIGSIC